MQKFENVPVHPETRQELRGFLRWLKSTGKHPARVVVSYDYLMDILLETSGLYHQYKADGKPGPIAGQTVYGGSEYTEPEREGGK